MPESKPGRCRGKRRISEIPGATYFKPAGIPLTELETTVLSFEEVEALRLADVLGLEQEDAAQKMGISRRTYWTDLKSARRKVATALVNGSAIKIEGGNYTLEE